MRLNHIALALAVVACLLQTSSAVGAGADCKDGEVHDDGTNEFLWQLFNGVADNRFVALFTPPTYPYVYQEICVSLKPTVANQPFEVVFFDDDGAGGSPGTELAAVPSLAPQSTACTFITVDVSSAGVKVADGSIYIGVRMAEIGSDTFVCRDNSNAYAPEYFFPVGPNWGLLGGSDALMIRASGKEQAVVPAVSEWSLIIMTVLAFTAGTILFGRRRAAAA